MDKDATGTAGIAGAISGPAKCLGEIRRDGAYLTKCSFKPSLVSSCMLGQGAATRPCSALDVKASGLGFQVLLLGGGATRMERAPAVARCEASKSFSGKECDVRGPGLSRRPVHSSVARVPPSTSYKINENHRESSRIYDYH